jgi:hypothetical protein
MSLNDYFWTNTGRPINKWTYYLPIYERVLAPFRNRSIVFLEIGTGQGGSSQMWKHYFGPAARIVSIDVREECLAFADEQVAVRIGDQSDPQFLQSLIDEFGAPDVVLDDGSHHADHVGPTFEYLYPRMPREALYVIEDTHTSYWPGWGGGLGKPTTIIERMKRLVDSLHADNPFNKTKANPPVPTDPLAQLTRSIQFYDSMVVLEKGPFVKKVYRSIPEIPGQKVW